MTDTRRLVSSSSPKFKILGVLGLILLVVLAFLGFQSLTGRGTAAAGPLVPPHPGTVLLNGHRMQFGCAGSGTPTVVLEGTPGFRDPGMAYFWPRAQQLLKICVFQATDFGKPGAPRTSIEEAGQIHAILHQQHVPGPYVLVGQESDDLRAFATLYRHDTGGLVFLDAAYPYFPRDLLRALGPRRPGEAGAITGIRNIFTTSRDGIVRYRALSDPKIVAMGGLGHLPVMVIPRGNNSVFGPDMPAPMSAKLQATWLHGQQHLVALSPNAREVIAAQSGNFTQMLQNQGDLVLFGIRLVQEAAGNVPNTLPPCVASFQPAVPSPFDQHPPFNDPSGQGKPAAICVPRGHVHSIAGIPCQVETLTFHVHAHLDLFVSGRHIPIPAGIGVNQQHDCLYWLHTHQTDGILHMESPHGIPHATLGTFFQVWGQPLSRSQIWTYRVGTPGNLRMYVNGKRYLGDPRTIALHRHTVITLEVGPPFTAPRPFNFGSQ